MPKKALAILAQGFEETEAVTAIDVLRRAGIDVTIAGLNDLKVKGSHGISIIADKKLEEEDIDFDACILPGGMPGAANLASSKKVQSILKILNQKGKIIAAICAAPAIVLAPLELLKNKSATCFPDLRKYFDKNVTYKEEKVVVDGNIITSQGLATALLFSLAIVEKLAGIKIRDKVKKASLAD